MAIVELYYRALKVNLFYAAMLIIMFLRIHVSFLHNIQNYHTFRQYFVMGIIYIYMLAILHQ